MKKSGITLVETMIIIAFLGLFISLLLGAWHRDENVISEEQIKKNIEKITTEVNARKALRLELANAAKMTLEKPEFADVVEPPKPPETPKPIIKEDVKNKTIITIGDSIVEIEANAEATINITVRKK